MDDESPEVSARHLLVCRGVDDDASEAGAGFTLRNVCESVRPPDDRGYPLVLEQAWVFAQLFGSPGNHQFRLQLVRFDDDSEGEEVTATFGPFDREVRRKRFVTGVCFGLWRVEFPESGMYEFRLFRDGQPEPLASERIHALGE